jgi:hypothetical protein
MDLFKIFVEMLDQPEAIQLYRKLQKCYKDRNMLDEAAAVSYLVEQKFGKKHEGTADRTLSDQK